MILVVGEALVDVVVDTHGTVTEAPGGSPLNVAVGLSRLGVSTTLLTELGDDARGRLVAGHVRDSGVTLVAGPPASGDTATATARLGADGSADYEFALDWTLPRSPLPDCDGLHVGSLGALLSPGRDSVADLVAQAVQRDLFVSYDVNLRETHLGDAFATRGVVRELAAQATLVKLSDEDALLLEPQYDPADVARHLLAAGRTRLVVLTRGAHGATAYLPGIEVTESPTRVTPVDTVGAGDAFMAALLAQLHATPLPAQESSLALTRHLGRLLAGANLVAAITCGRRGADPPRRDELPERWPAG